MKKPLLLLLLTPMLALADPGHVRLAWDKNPETDIAKYRLHYGLASNKDPAFAGYTGTLDVPPNVVMLVNESGELVESISEKLKLPAGGIYYCVVTAINEAGLESDYSNEISFTMPQKPENPRINKNK